MAKIGILGAGTWGIALARMLCNSGHDIVVWSALPKEVETYSQTRRQPNLPGMVIPDAIVFTGDIEEACIGKDIVLFAVPSVFTRNTARQAAPYIPDGQIVADVAKGIEPKTHFTLTEVIGDELSKDGKHDHVRLVALSGPTHAEEVAMDMPTTIVSASTSPEAAGFVQDIFMNTCMRVYTNSDVKGVDLCGARNNIIALASGMIDGLGYGDNTRAALITRGMAEITRLGLAMGCNPGTFYGLAGIGDLIVTATSRHSRNFNAGHLMGMGKTPEEAVREVGMVVEGINALPAAMELEEQYHTELPICNGVNRIVKEHADPLDIVRELMERPKKAEAHL